MRVQRCDALGPRAVPMSFDAGVQVAGVDAGLADLSPSSFDG